MIALLVGGSAGAAVGHRVGSRPVGPTAPPAVTAEFPDASQRHLRGITVSGLAEDWLAGTRSWKCEVSDTGTELSSGASTLMGCTPPGERAQALRVNIEYDGEKQVRAVHGLCAYGPGHQACRRLFTDLAEVLLAGDDSLRTQAVDWVETHVDTDDSTVVGNVRLIVSLTPHYLRGTPAS